MRPSLPPGGPDSAIAGAGAAAARAAEVFRVFDFALVIGWVSIEGRANVLGFPPPKAPAKTCPGLIVAEVLASRPTSVPLSLPRKSTPKTTTALRNTRLFRPSSDKGFEHAFLIRMLFSCLVDADFLETKRFYTQAERGAVARGGHLDLAPPA